MEFTIGLCQMPVCADKEKNLATAERFCAQAARQGADIVVLPEMFCCPYDTGVFMEYADAQGGPVFSGLRDIAKALGVYLIGGSLPELDARGALYNTCFSFDRQGNRIGRHRKAHLFDVDIKGGQYFKESDVLTPGSEITVIETEFGKVGVGICFDIRFAELSRAMQRRGAKALIFPAAFNMTTGPAHWELLFRARALDNQLYTFGCAPARNESAAYVSYGNSIAVDPWGTVVARLDREEGVLLQRVDLAAVESVREQLPVVRGLREDLYHPASRP